MKQIKEGLSCREMEKLSNHDKRKVNALSAPRELEKTTDQVVSLKVLCRDFSNAGVKAIKKQKTTDATSSETLNKRCEKIHTLIGQSYACNNQARRRECDALGLHHLTCSMVSLKRRWKHG